MDNDDVLIGRVLSRREAVRLLGVAGAGLLVGCQRSAPNASGAGATARATTAGAAGGEVAAGAVGRSDRFQGIRGGGLPGGRGGPGGPPLRRPLG